MRVLSERVLSDTWSGADKETRMIACIIQDYFDGLHEGDTAKLDRIFHDDVVLKAPGLRRSKQAWLEIVARRPVPAREGAVYQYHILSIDRVKDQAMVKLECPLSDHFYVDFIGLLKENGQWQIVSKMYSDLASATAKH